MFAADWRTIFSFLFTPPFHVLLCFLLSWLCAVLHEVVLWVYLDGRKSERRVFRWGLLSGKRASSAGRASRGLQDLLFMRRVLLCKSLTVIPLMKWEYIFSCRFIWKCLKKKRFFSFSFFWPRDIILAPSVKSEERFIWCHADGRQWPFVLIQGPFAEQACSWSYSRSSLSTELTEDPESCTLLTWIWNKIQIKKHKNNKESLLQVIMCLVCCPCG